MGGRVVAGAIGLALGLVSLSIAVGSPAYSFAGTAAGALALLLAGWSLIAAGLAFWSARPGIYVGPLLVAAGFAWFIAEWDNPAVGSSAVFTVGLVLSMSSPVLVSVVIFAHPSGRVPGWPERLAVAALVTGTVILLGVLWAMSSDPRAGGCVNCPPNLVLVDADSGRAADLAQAGIRLGAVASAGLIGLIVWRLLRSGPAKRRVIAPTMLAGALYLVAVAWTFAANRDRAYLGSGPLEQRLWFVQAGALVLLSAAVLWGRLRNRRTRQSLVDLVVELGKTSAIGGLRDALSVRLGDPDLEVGYAIGDGRWVTASGSDVSMPTTGDGRSVTPLVRDGEHVAVIIHRSGVLDDADLVAEVTSSARLLLDNERLQVDVRAREADLRASRARIVESGDAERRRLERDLHDGAQQRLVGLMLGLRLARAGVDGDQNELRARLAATEGELAGAVSSLRDVATGIHPAALSTFGLSEALGALAERSGNIVRVTRMPEERLPPAVETAAYCIVKEAVAGGAVVVDVVSTNGLVHVEVGAAASPDALIELEDRVGALDGWVRVEPNGPGSVVLSAVIPCGL